MRLRGIALVPALFLVVALAALGAALMHFTSTQQITHAYDQLGSQGLAVARAGTEWAAYQIKSTSACPSSPTTFSANPLSNAFTVTVACQSAGPFTDEGKTVRIFRVTATAATDGAPGHLGYVERQVEAVIVKEN